MILSMDSTPSVTRWSEVVKIARKGFEVLSKGEGQAMAWRPKNLARVKKQVPAFSPTYIRLGHIKVKNQNLDDIYKV